MMRRMINECGPPQSTRQLDKLGLLFGVVCLVDYRASWAFWMKSSGFCVDIPITVVLLTYGRFVQSFAFVEEVSDVLGVHSQQMILAKILNACK